MDVSNHTPAFLTPSLPHCCRSILKSDQALKSQSISKEFKFAGPLTSPLKRHSSGAGTFELGYENIMLSRIFEKCNSLLALCMYVFLCMCTCVCVRVRIYAYVYVYIQDAIEKCSALLFFPFVSCHDNIDPNPYMASCVSDLCV